MGTKFTAAQLTPALTNKYAGEDSTGATKGYSSGSDLATLIRTGTTTNDNATAGQIGEYIYCAGDANTATVTITNASPAVVTWTAHGYQAGQVINFTTTGGLPSGLSVGTNYYILATGLTVNTFQLATAPFGTAINTSTNGSGTHTGIASAIMATGTTANVAGISLTAGDWDVWGEVIFLPNGSSTIARINAGISTSSAAFPSGPLTDGGAVQNLSLTFTTGAFQQLFCGRTRISLSGTSTIYLVGRTTFGVSTMACYGFIGARRVR